jgi:predicted nucleotide-binding protein
MADAPAYAQQRWPSLKGEKRRMGSEARLFVGSSTEGHRVAQAIQVLLDPVCEVEVWSQGAFGLSRGNLDSLVLALDQFDFAVLVLTADDMTLRRGKKLASPRDNVLFELGLFMGGLGRDRTFMVYDRNNPPALPTDLAGVTAATFEPHRSGNMQGALGAACTHIQTQIEKLGLRDSKKSQLLSQATNAMEGAGDKMQDLIRLLARSRKVELDIISVQFGAMIAPEKLRQMKEDLHALEALLHDES